MVLIRSVARYYPQQQDPRLNEDLRVAYDHIYTMQGHLARLSDSLAAAHSSLKQAHAKLDSMPSPSHDPAGPSTSKITGLNVEGIPPQQGKQVTNLSGLPVMVYDATTGQITWKIPA